MFRDKTSSRAIFEKGFGDILHVTLCVGVCITKEALSRTPVSKKLQLSNLCPNSSCQAILRLIVPCFTCMVKRIYRFILR